LTKSDYYEKGGAVDHSRIDRFKLGAMKSNLLKSRSDLSSGSSPTWQLVCGAQGRTFNSNLLFRGIRNTFKPSLNT